MEQRTETENRETNKTPTHTHGPAGPCDEWTTPQRPDAAGLLWQMGRRVRMPAQWTTVRIHIAGTAGTIRVASRWYAALVMRQEVEKLRADAARVAGLAADG